MGLNLASAQVVSINDFMSPYFPAFLTYKKLREVSLMFPILKTLEMSFASCGWLDSQLNLSQKHFGGILQYLSKGQLLANLTWVDVKYWTTPNRYRDNSCLSAKPEAAQRKSRGSLKLFTTSVKQHAATCCVRMFPLNSTFTPFIQFTVLKNPCAHMRKCCG